MQPISESDYKFLKEQADHFDLRLSKIIDNLIIFSSYLHKNNSCLIKIEPSETYFLNEKTSTVIPNGKLDRNTCATIILSISYPTESGLVKVGTCGLIYNRKTNSIIIDYIQGQKNVKIDNSRAKKFREDLLSTVVSCTYNQVKDQIFYPDIKRIKQLSSLEKPLAYIRERGFDKEGKLKIEKPLVQSAIQNKLTLDFVDFPDLKEPKLVIPNRRIKNPRRNLK
ncbi:MAG: hypothetical protein WCX82_02430 [archaeon]|jgi:hypothetical protein